jgi:hypothetical protein
MIRNINILILFITLAFNQLLAQETKTLQKKKGFLSINEIGVMLTNASALYTNSNAQALFFHSFNAYQVAPALAVGLGLGMDSYPDRLLMPLTIGISGDILKKNITPFYRFLIGHGYNLSKVPGNNVGFINQDFTLGGGLVVNPAIGLKVYVADNKAFVLLLAYKYQETYTEQIVRGSSSFRQEVNFRRLAFSIGFSF